MRALGISAWTAERLGHERDATADGDSVMQQYINSRKVGAVFYLFVVSATFLSLIGIAIAVRAHAPAWAILLSVSILAISVPMGGLVAYAFFIPKGNGSRSSSLAR